MTALRLPRADGRLRTYRPVSGPAPPGRGPPPRARTAFAAAHVVADPLVVADPPTTAAVDWEATLAFRRHLWSLGLGVAEAMDTAQRGMGLDWPTTRRLVTESVAEARAAGGRVACGAGTDQLTPAPGVTPADVRRAYEEQCTHVEDAGGQVILMASRALAACARGPDDYHDVYDAVLSGLRRPAILHWLGPMFDPALAGYWGHDGLDQATEVALDVITRHAERIEGVKLSLLDLDRELALRARLPRGVAMFTGDDFNYVDAILGDGQRHSDALLGIFDAIAPAAARALRALDDGDEGAYKDILAPTVALSRHLFGEATRHYKTGIVFLAWLNGHQRHFRMVGGLESARSVPHLAEAFVLADRAGVLTDPGLAVSRLRHLLAVAGVEQ